MYLCVLSIKTIFSNILQHTYVCTDCSKCNWTKKAKVIMMNEEEVFSIQHSVLHWAHQCSTGSNKCLFIWWFVCVIWKQNTILRRNNIVLNVKFHFAGELRGFAHCVCVFWFVFRVLRAWRMLSECVCKQSRKTVSSPAQSFIWVYVAPVNNIAAHIRGLVHPISLWSGHDCPRA